MPGLTAGGSRQTDAAAPTRPGWRETPEYITLFAPAAHAAAYRAYVSPLPLGAVLRTLDGDRSLLRPDGAWQARSLGPLDAFGRSGGYDRLKLARLYGGRGVQQARGPRVDGGRVVETWSLVSPYPDPSLERLEEGTLILVLTLGGPDGPRLRARP